MDHALLGKRIRHGQGVMLGACELKKLSDSMEAFFQVLQWGPHSTTARSAAAKPLPPWGHTQEERGRPHYPLLVQGYHSAYVTPAVVTRCWEFCVSHPIMNLRKVTG